MTACLADLNICPPGPDVITGLCIEAPACGQIDCVTKTTTRAVVNGACVETVVYTTSAGAPIAPPVREVACWPVVRAVVLNAPAPPPPTPAPINVAATTCGPDGTVLAADALSTRVHTAPGTALLVKLCPTTDVVADREMVVLCAPDGTRVAVQNVTPSDAPLGTAPTFEGWLLDGTPYGGVLSDLAACAAEQVDVAQAGVFCAAGVSLNRVDFWDVSAGTPTLIGSIWQDALGAVVPAPTAANLGPCPEVAGTFEQNVHWCNIDSGECEEGIAAYTRDLAGNVVIQSLVFLNGTVVTTSGALTRLQDGPCPEIPKVEFHFRETVVPPFVLDSLSAAGGWNGCPGGTATAYWTPGVFGTNAPFPPGPPVINGGLEGVTVANTCPPSPTPGTPLLFALNDPVGVPRVQSVVWTSGAFIAQTEQFGSEFGSGFFNMSVNAATGVVSAQHNTTAVSGTLNSLVFSLDGVPFSPGPAFTTFQVPPSAPNVLHTLRVVAVYDPGTGPVTLTSIATFRVGANAGVGRCSSVFRAVQCDGSVIWTTPTGASHIETGTETIGPCRSLKVTDRAICADVDVGGVSQIWNVLERTTEQQDGTTSVAYVDPDVSPVQDVTASLLAIRHGGPCECCRDNPSPLRFIAWEDAGGGLAIGNNGNRDISDNFGDNLASRTIAFGVSGFAPFAPYTVVPTLTFGVGETPATVTYNPLTGRGTVVFENPPFGALADIGAGSVVLTLLNGATPVGSIEAIGNNGGGLFGFYDEVSWLAFTPI